MSNFQNPKVPPTGGPSASQITFEGTDLGLRAAARLCSLLRSSQTHRSLACDALHRASPDPKRLGDLQDTHAFRKLLSHKCSIGGRLDVAGSYALYRNISGIGPPGG